MSEAIVCTVCNQNEASEKCTICGIDLCEICQQIVHTEDISAAHRVKGMSTEGVLGPAQKKRIVCSKCLAENDFMDKEEHGEEEEAETATSSIKGLFRAFKRPGKGEVMTKVGDHPVDLSEITPEIWGKEEMLREILRDDYIEARFKQYNTRIRPLARNYDLAEWDRILLKRYKPLYTQLEGNGKEDEIKQAVKNLQAHLFGAGQSLTLARRILDEALKAFGPEKETVFGQAIEYNLSGVASVTGFTPKNLGGMDQALKYAEGQMVEQMAVLSQGTGDIEDLESRAFHLGTLQFLAAEIEEQIKICCFGYVSADDLPAKEMAFFPEARTPVGLATVDLNKPVLSFFGDDFLPIFYAVGQLEEDGLDRDIEITGLGNAGLELARMYPAGKVLTSTPKAIKAVRLGLPDLIVASDSCGFQNTISQAGKAGIPVLAVGPCASYPFPDRSDEAEETLIAALQNGEGLMVHALDKAARIVSGYFKNFAGKKGQGIENGVIDNAKEACTACDLCFHACPNSLMISPAIKESGQVSLTELYDRCLFCGQCESVCPENIPVMDCLLAASREKISTDRYRMRPGRGPLSHLEFRDLTFGLMLGGNGPAMVALLGCGHYPGSEQDMVALAEELLERNCVVMTAGCGAMDISRKLEEKTGKCLPENFHNMATLKGLVNSGGCAADAHIMSAIYKLSQLGGGISVKGNFDQQADYIMNRAPFTVLIWGGATDKMYAKATGFARIGARVVVGPTGFNAPRALVGNKYQREDWTMYDGFGEGEREVDPSPAHLIMPVETREEAVTMILKYSFTTCDLRDSRLSSLDNYTGAFQKFFDELPDDWNFFVRSPLEIHVMKRMKYLKILREQYGWEITGATVNKVKDRGGNMVTLDQYTNEYGIKQGRYATMVPRLIMQQALKIKEDEDNG